MKKLLLALSVILIAIPISAQRRFQRRPLAASMSQFDLDEDDTPLTVPPGVRAMRDLAYANDPLQRLDVYIPQNVHRAPIIFMVHGGGWRTGDKSMKRVVENKLRHWSAMGYVFVSVNNRLLPDASPLEQARDVAKALAFTERQAASWGADPSRVIIMGHSAGAHLISLVATSDRLAPELAGATWIGAVSLDSAALDVVEIMEKRHFPLYDKAFGSEPAFWRSASPYHALTHREPPFLAVCSSRRADSCTQADRFVAKAKSLGINASVLPEDLSHREINETLGEPSAYTDAVDRFINSCLALHSR